jgi:phage terminase large subunit-like protein
MVDVAHTVTNFSEPMKTLDALIVAGKVRHDGDPVLSWAMANVHGKQDAKDNVYPRKTRDSDKIDPAVALIAAMSIHLREQIQHDWDFKVVAI